VPTVRDRRKHDTDNTVPGDIEIRRATTLKGNIMNDETNIETPCDECGAIHDRDNENMSWSEVAELTHAIHVCRFGYCFCADGERQYDDCPKDETVIEYTVRITVVTYDPDTTGDKIGDILDDYLHDIGEIAELTAVAGARVVEWSEVSA
jgi:hypothetical protein